MTMVVLAGNKSARILGLAALAAALLAGCGAVSNAPTPSPLPAVQNKVGATVAWRTNIGAQTDFRFLPAQLGSDKLVVAGAANTLALLNVDTGAKLWQVQLEKPVAGGVGANGDLIAVGTLKGELFAFGDDGKSRWKVQLSSEIIAPPTIAQNIVMVRTGDGRISGLSAKDGSRVWQFQRQLPALTLRNFAPMAVVEGSALAGLAGGRLVALGIVDGRVLWDSPVALPRGATELERVADVVSAPVVTGNQVCAAAYQGRVSCFSVLNGTLAWSREASSFSGVAVDSDHLYLVDAEGAVQAFERISGRSLWRQDKLVARSVGSPAIVNGKVAVADYEGYVHFLNPEDGSLVGQLATDGSRIAAAPQAINDKLIVQTQSGNVFALKVNK
ncbi:outer membrane protein assembly factor BamB [Andreprevotia chitinilytica]|uniref:outer membrane protein assembly factor BamB n=1 Tax=Andreprevotia chitinilytica TaxID=396808 RepID=UPI00068A8432|nr:outer membrane protein assembly factor BamB [Andreprevotia chitinilytica]